MSTNDALDVEMAKQLDRLMRRIHGRLTATAEDFDVHKVGPGGGMLLLTIDEIAPAPMSELVQRLARDKSQMTRAVQALEAKGLVTRAGSPDDARKSMVSLTPAGASAVIRIQQAVAKVLDGLLEPLTADDRDTLRSLLARL